MRLRRLVFLTCFWLLSPCLQASAPAPLRVCMSEVPHYPWRVADLAGRVGERGLDFELLRAFEARRLRSVQLLMVAGRRCLVELQAGRADATIGLSHTEERAQYVRYPMRKGGLDLGLALRTDSYSLYHPAGQRWSWDGKRLQGPPGARIAAQPSSSVTDWLRAGGHAVDDGERRAAALLQRVLDGQVAAAALLRSEAEVLRAANPELALLSRLDPPLLSRPYFVVFSKHFAERNEAELPMLWRALAEAAQFPAYQQAVRAAEQGH